MDFAYAIKSIFREVKNFFVNTFRRHSPAEYAETITRGLRSDRGINTQYPWLYVRTFALGLILFAAYLLAVRLSGNEMFIPSALVFGGITFALSFIILLYELYPRKDFSMISLAAVVVLGGAFACLLSQALGYFTPAASGWLGSFRSGGLEEVSKAFVCILIIVIVRIRSPLLGFLIGAAVGAGFSIVEDMGYIFLSSDDWLASDIPAIVRVFFSRGMTVFCTHSVWTGLVGWAYARFDKHINNAAFYATALLSILLHSLWNNPLTGSGALWLVSACVIVALLAVMLIYIEGRRNALGGDVQTQLDASVGIKAMRTGKFFRHGATLSFAFYGVALAICALVYCALPVQSGYTARKFEDKEEFAEFAQNGHDLSADWSRTYDPSGGDVERVYVGDELTQVVQLQESGGYEYYYYYTVDGGSYKLTQIMAEVEDGGATMRYACTQIYYRGSLYLNFFMVNGSITGYAVGEDGAVTAVLYDEAGADSRFPDEYSTIGYVALALTIAETVVFTALTVKGNALDKKLDITDAE